MTFPTTSDALPAANGETMRTERVGQSCADAPCINSAPIAIAINPAKRFIAAPSALRDLAGVDLEHLVEAPARDLAAGREPHAVGVLHVLDDRAHGAGAAGTTRDVRMELER